MKIWITFFSVILLASCSSSSIRGLQSDVTSSTTNSAKILKSTAGGITASSHGKGDSRVKAEKSFLRRAIKEAIPLFAGTAQTSSGLKNAITKWVNEQQSIDYEDMVKRMVFDIDTKQGGEYFLEGSVVLNQAYLKSQVEQFIQTCRLSRRCGGSLKIYITMDTSTPFSAEEIKLGSSFVYSLRQQFIAAGFEIKTANQQNQAQYQLNLINITKEVNNQNLNIHFTVEALDNRADSAVFATVKKPTSVSISAYGHKVAESKALDRAADTVGANLIQQIIRNNSITEVVFYANTSYSNDIEQQLAVDLAQLYGINTQDIISAQSTPNDGYTSWSFEFSAALKPSELEIKRGLGQIQKKVLRAESPRAESTKAARKWSSFDNSNPPGEFKKAQTNDIWTVQVEALIREGKLDTPTGSGHNAYDTVRAKPNHPNAKMLLQRISEVFLKNAEKSLDKNQVHQARRYLNRAKTIWPQNPGIANLQTAINNTSIYVPRPAPDQTYLPITIKPDPSQGKLILEKGKYWALLIGNQEYTKGLESLQTPIADIRSLKKILKNNYGFEKVVTVENGTKKEIINALYSLQTKIKKNDNLLIFYAGHGEQEKDFGGKGFWIPVDGKPPYAESKEYLSSWIPNSLVHDIIQVSKAKHVLLVSDSCFSGTFKASTRGLARQKVTSQNGSSALNQEIYNLASLTSRKAISSGDLEPVTDSGSGGHSIFAYHLIKVLNEKKVITAKQLFQKIRSPITQAVKQQPQYFIIDRKKDQGGDFIFLPK